MLNIRTITVGAREEDLGRAARAAQRARERLVQAGYPIQTLRLALTPGGANRCADFATVARGVEQQALDAGFDYVSLGPLDAERLAALPDALAATEAVFASAVITGRDGTIYPAAIQGAAVAMVQIAQLGNQGFGNLRFAAAAGVGPGSPFFPAAAHDGGAPWLAIGPEAATLAVESVAVRQQPAASSQQPAASGVSRPESLWSQVLWPSAPLTALTQLIEHHDAAIHTALAGLADETGVRIAGCDWSLAPHPAPERSIGAAIEALSGVPFGAWGTLAAVRTITAAIRAARVTQVGFSGVMLPVLEDAVLAQRNTEGRFRLRDLLAFSAVCGTGLDTIPLPGDTSVTQLGGVLHEVAALAAALHKPLTARLLPIPGLQAGDTTGFGWEFFVNTRVMEVIA